MNNTYYSVSTQDIKKEYSSFKKKVKKYGILYILAAPALIYLLIFKLLPILFAVVAFKQYLPWKGILGSEWVGLYNFKMLFNTPDFYSKLLNSLLINSYKLTFGFPAPIIFSLLLNEIRKNWFKRTIQTISYFPYFISWVIIAGIFYNFLSYDWGIFNTILRNLGYNAVEWYQTPKYWRGLIVISNIWKNIGYTTIIYLAAITSIDIQLYEAAEVDGAGRFRRMLHITLPGIFPIVTVTFLLTVGYMISGDFEQIQAIMGENGALYGKIDILETYMFRIATGKIDLISFGTAVGMFQSIIAFILIYSANMITKKFNEYTLW